MKRIAVVGAGPKGLAIAAKAFALNKVLGKVVTVTLFDHNGYAANWRGDNGFTDGVQRLCTPIERDLGFPYASRFPAYDAALGRRVDKILLSKISWQSYAIAKRFYGDWVSLGRPLPSHGDFASYLEWAGQEMKADLVRQKVIGLSYAQGAGEWVVKTSLGESRFDGVVMTGGVKNPEDTFGGGSPAYDGLIYSASQYWGDVPKVFAALRRAVQEDSVAKVAFIGAGAAAATISNDLISRIREISADGQDALELTFLTGGHGMMRLRHPNFYEDRLFHDHDAWAEFDNKPEFVRSVVNSAVWTPLFDQFAQYKNVIFRALKAVDVKPLHPGGGPLRPQAVFAFDHAPAGPVWDDIPYDLVIDSIAPDARWFMQQTGRNRAFLSDDIKTHLRAELAGPVPLLTDFSFAPKHGTMGAGLHAPMLGAEISPGAGNLMALGVMSDHILQSYLP